MWGGLVEDDDLDTHVAGFRAKYCGRGLGYFRERLEMIEVEAT
jgi:hypothetical protein